MLTGGGMATLPTHLVGEDLQKGRLARVRPWHGPDGMGIHAIDLSRQHHPLALRLRLDFLADRFGGATPAWDQA